MIDNNKILDIIERRKKMQYDDPGIIDLWEELVMVFSENEEYTINYLNNCSKEYLFWISEVFEDISENLQSEQFLHCIQNLEIKYPDLSLEYDNQYAEKSLKNTVKGSVDFI